MMHLFDVNLVCLDGGGHFMEEEEQAKSASSTKDLRESPPADFIRTPVSGSDQLDATGLGGVIDFDLDDDTSSEEDEGDEGISDNDDSDDTASAVEETPKRDHGQAESIGVRKPSQFSSLAPHQRRIKNVPKNRLWHIEMLESLIGRKEQYCHQPVPLSPLVGGAMTYEEALRRQPSKRHAHHASSMPLARRQCP